MAAHLTGEHALGFAIRLFSVSTLAASPGGVARVNLDQRYSAQLGLVSKKLAKLGECPTMQPCPLPLSGPYPRTDAGEFFNGNRPIRAFRGLDDALGNYVIRVAGEIRLAFCSLLQQSFGRLGSLALEFAKQGAVAVSHFVQAAAGILSPVRVNGNLDDAQVHAQNIDRLNLLIFGHLDGDIQEPFSPAQDQVCFSVRVGKL
jgi:hypothetical protein